MEFWGSTLRGKWSNASKNITKLWARCTQGQEQLCTPENKKSVFGLRVHTWEESFKHLLQMLLLGSYKSLFEWLCRVTAWNSEGNKIYLSSEPLFKSGQGKGSEKNTNVSSRAAPGVTKPRRLPRRKLCWISADPPWHSQCSGLQKQRDPQNIPVLCSHHSCPGWGVKNLNLDKTSPVQDVHSPPPCPNTSINLEKVFHWILWDISK